MTENIFPEVGKRIRALRGELSQAGIAMRIGVSSKAVEGWEAGASLPSGASLLRMHESFGADITYILTGKTGGEAPLLLPDEEQLLANYRQANSDGRERIRQISATAANSPKRAPRPAAPAHQIGGTHSQHASGAGSIQIGEMTSTPAKRRG